MLFKRLTAPFIIFVLVFSSFLPTFTQKTEAQSLPGIPQIVFDPTHTGVTTAEATRRTVRDVVDAAARIVAQAAIQRIVSSTVSWANSGFEGNPAYVTDPKQYFTDLADGVAGEFIQGSELGFLCSPFQANIRLSLIQQYYEPQQFQCTLTDTIGNIENFYSDFSQGGWEAWFSMTQNPSNNPYGAYLEAKMELDSRIASAVGLQNKQLDWNQGYLSWADCISNDPETGECLERGPIKTPGAHIKSQIDRVLPAGLEKLLAVEHVEDLAEAFAVGLLKKYVFGPEGLFNNDRNDTETANLPVDIDGDGIVDGIDTNSDGQPDICYYGGISSPLTPPCRGSSNTSNPPYVPIPGSGGPGAQCTDTGNQYASALQSAMNAVLSDNPSIGNLPNIEDANGYKTNAKFFLDLVADEINSSETLRADSDILNGNDNPSTGDIIGIWRSGDLRMERYDAIIGSAATIASAIQTDFDAFIPLNCTASGGGSNCGCQTTGGGTTPPGTGTPGTPGGPSISSISTSNIIAGATTLQIFGSNLTNTVQFFDGAGDRNTVLGSVNSSKTQVTILAPADLAPGFGSVRVYQNANSVSNTINIQITTGSASNITTANITSSWSPSHSNGWWPSLSPDGEYVAYGNWGGSFVTNLESKQTWDFSNPPGDLPAGSRCMAGQWLSNTKMTFVCELGPASNQGRDGFLRYEVNVGEWEAIKTNDDPSNTVSSMWRAKDGHFASYLAAQSFRVTKDNQVAASGTGGAISIGGDTLVHACSNENQQICVRHGLDLYRTFNVRTPLHLTATKNEYILYGGYGPVRGITPNGSDVDLTVTPWRRENPSELLSVNGRIWISTLGWNETNNYVLLRPWGSRSTIVVEVPATSASVVYNNGVFTIAYNDEVGNMAVITVPGNAPRHQF